jgi:hypothetical protein
MKMFKWLEAKRELFFFGTDEDQKELQQQHEIEAREINRQLRLLLEQTKLMDREITQMIKSRHESRKQAE